jgi:GH43 family beta-xylosidase
MRFIILLMLSLLLVSWQGDKPDKSEKSFTNPIFSSGADPWIIHKDGLYYFTSTSGRNLYIRSGKNLDELARSEMKVIWTPPEGTSYSKEIWAPELHFINHRWYMYFAADNGENRNHRMYVIENSTRNPLEGTWEFKGKVADQTDKWAIDGSVFEFRKQLYMIWSGWEGDINGQQNIYIAKLKNPWTIDGRRVLISSPEYNWETIGDLNNPGDVPHVNVNEGPVALQRKGKLFIVFSASGCWTDNYCLGILTFTGKDNLLDPGSWRKNPDQVFTQAPEAKVFAPGHNSFFKSPDGKEDWILYHANSKPGQGCGGHRSPRAQKFGWNSDGTPAFGEPVGISAGIRLPSGK